MAIIDEETTTKVCMSSHGLDYVDRIAYFSKFFHIPIPPLSWIIVVTIP
jgi:hypothetical protein